MVENSYNLNKTVNKENKENRTHRNKDERDKLTKVGNSSGSKYLILLTFASALGGFLFGYDTGVVSGAMLLIREDFHLTTFWHELIVSATMAAAWGAALIAGPSADRWGRRVVILFSSMVFTAGAIVMGVAPNKQVLLVGRVIVGIGIGFASVCVPVFISELSPAHLRGQLTIVNVVFLTGGQFVANLISGGFSKVNGGWRWMLGLGAVPAIVQFIAFLFAPESPRWLYNHGRLSKARRILTKFRSSDTNIEAELETYNVLDIEQPTPSLKSIAKSDPVRRALVVGCLLQFFQQFTGINTVMYYSASIISMAGVSNSSTAIWLAAVTSGFNFAFTFVGLYLVERVGRRPLVLFSLIGVTFALLTLALSFQLAYVTGPDVFDVSNETKCSAFASCSLCTEDSSCGFCFSSNIDGDVTNSSCLISDNTNYDESSIDVGCRDSDLQDWAYNWCPSHWAWLSVVGLCLYLMCFAPGMGTIPWTMNSEIYPLWARGRCVSIATSFNWASNIIVSLSFLTLTEVITKQGAFYLFTGITIVAFATFYIILPETKGVPLEKMEEVFALPLCSSRKRRRKIKKLQKVENTQF